MQKTVWGKEEIEEDFLTNLEAILEESERDFQEGRFYDAREVFKELRKKYNF